MKNIDRIESRGPVSDELLEIVGSGDRSDRDAVGLQDAVDRALSDAAGDVVRSEDIQLSLFVLYSLAYGGLFADTEHLEWHPGLIRERAKLEAALESSLRERMTAGPLPAAQAGTVAAHLFEMAASDTGPSLSRFLAKKATIEQASEFLVHRSIYTLKEADPHSWAIPRLTGRAKAALVEIQADEYGGGNAVRMHSAIFAGTLRAAGLDDRYGAYLNQVPAIVLASFNTMSMFGLNRRLLGAIVGHLAAFEMTSSIPNRLYGNGFRRLGYGRDLTWYFDEHVEADAVHEQIAAHDLAGTLAEDHPELLGDIIFGAQACLTLDGWVAEHMLECWNNASTSLRVSPGSASHELPAGSDRLVEVRQP
jgi:hypothetical protein